MTAILPIGDQQRRDDGVGFVVCRALAAEGLPDGVEVLEGGKPGIAALLDLADFDRVVVIQAMDIGLAPGEHRVLSREELETILESNEAPRGAMSLPDILDLAGLSGFRCEWVILAVQPGEIAPGTGLTVEVGQALSGVIESAREITEGPTGQAL